MSNKIRISGCMIVRNEEANIANCINNLKNVTDEIIVVDTGSEDQTIQIAKDLGAFVYEHEWENDFSKAKNTALGYAKGDWIIFLDADEYFSEDSLTKVRSIIQKVHSNRNVDGIQCGLVNIDTDTNKVIGTYDTLRIFRNSKQFRFINRIHEEIRNNGKALRCENVREEILIIHTGYSASIAKKKAERNLELLLNNTDDEKSDYYLAISYFQMEDHDNALKHADLGLLKPEINQHDYLAYKLHVIRIAITVDQEFHNKEKIRTLIEGAERSFGNHPEIHKIAATYYLKEKQYEKALEKYLSALECQKQNGTSWTQNDFEGKLSDVYYAIAEILSLMNREAEALNYYVKLLNVDKYHVKGFSSMLKLFRELPEDDTICFLNGIYNSGTEEDIRFILSIITKTGMSKLILYYAILWNRTFLHEDDVLIYAFLAQGNYTQALEIAMLYLAAEQKAFTPLVTAIILMGGLFSESDAIRDKIGPDYSDLISSYAEGRRFNGEKSTCMSVFSILAKHGGRYDITDMIGICSDLDHSVEWDMAEVFLSDHRYEQAIPRYTACYSSAGLKDRKASTAFRLGCCHYKLRQYRESLEWFERAIENGYSDNDLAEFLRWITAQAPDSEIKQRAENLIASYRSMIEAGFE